MIPRDRTMLVVEDNQDHALLVRIAVRRSFPEIDIRVAGDGGEGIAYLAGTPPFQNRQSHPYPNLVVLDLFMPGMDGFGLLAWIHEQGGSRVPPVAVLTSSINPRDEARALELGAQSFHAKPTDVEELCQVVKEIVQQWIR